MTDIVYCCARVWGNRGWDHRCSRRMVVTRDGKPFCRQHDPEVAKARREEADRKAQQKYQAEQQCCADAMALIYRLGVGRPHYDTRNHSYTGGIVLTADEATRLIARLERERS